MANRARLQLNGSTGWKSAIHDSRIHWQTRQPRTKLPLIVDSLCIANESIDRRVHTTGEHAANQPGRSTPATPPINHGVPASPLRLCELFHHIPAVTASVMRFRTTKSATRQTPPHCSPMRPPVPAEFHKASSTESRFPPATPPFPGCNQVCASSGFPALAAE